MKVVIGNYHPPKWIEWAFNLFGIKYDRKVSVQIDPWDTWSADHTLATIIVPVLKQLRKDAMGSSAVDDEDVPKGMRRKDAKPTENQWDVDEHWHKRWDWVLGEMIMAFECIAEKDWVDWDKATEERVNNGLRLFGKYYMGLWD